MTLPSLVDDDAPLEDSSSSLRAAQRADPHPDGQVRAPAAALIGRSAVLRRVMRQVDRVAPTPVSVLLAGESGTGRQLLAQVIHDRSARATQAFVTLDCRAPSAALIDSELFGHEKGALPGAGRRHRGVLEQAEGGTLLLRELARLPEDVQARLARALDTGVFCRLGGDEVLRVDVRLIATADRPVIDCVRAGQLSQELLSQLDAVELTVPPLRERREDIDPLAHHFLSSIAAPEGLRRRFTRAALDRLRQHAWPGNIRQLRNMVQRAFIMADQEEIDRVDLPEDEVGTDQSSGQVQQITVPVGTSIADVERQLILATLARCNGLREPAARMLGISLKTLYNRLREYGVLAGPPA
jgi:DNA-binding NtrC family response regulator